MTQIQAHDLVDEDHRLINELKERTCLDSLDAATPKFRELTTGILFQFADSQLAGASGYNACLNWGPTLDDRIELGKVVVEKMEMARNTYAILAGQNLNVNKYFAAHSWDAKVLRDADLGFRRASADKRLNALMYPLESWVDMSVFAYLMSSATCYTLSDFLSCSFAPLKDLAKSCLNLEKGHESFGERQLRRISKVSSSAIVIQSSINYWYDRVATSFGPAQSARNDLHRLFHLKSATNCELRQKWADQAQEFFAQIDIKLPVADLGNAAACN